jgi:hypothetical protein
VNWKREEVTNESCQSQENVGVEWRGELGWKRIVWVDVKFCPSLEARKAAATEGVLAWEKKNLLSKC